MFFLLLINSLVLILFNFFCQRNSFLNLKVNFIIQYHLSVMKFGLNKFLLKKASVTSFLFPFEYLYNNTYI